MFTSTTGLLLDENWLFEFTKICTGKSLSGSSHGRNHTSWSRSFGSKQLQLQYSFLKVSVQCLKQLGSHEGCIASCQRGADWLTDLNSRMLSFGEGVEVGDGLSSSPDSQLLH